MSGALVTLRQEIPHVQWEIKNEKKKGVVADKTVYKQERYTGVQVTRDNVKSVLVDWLKGKDLLRPDQQPMLEQVLETANQEI
jgi:K+-sensing histidine kinase KdpD